MQTALRFSKTNRILQVILDPVSPVAQRVAPLLKLLQDTAAVDVEIMLVPTQELEKMPLESYYAYAAPQRVGGAGGGALPLLAPPAARFGALPQNRVLTMNVDVPEPWLTEARATDSTWRKPHRTCGLCVASGR